MAKKRVVRRKRVHEGEEEFGYHPDTIHKVVGRWLGSADILLEGVKLRLYYFGINENSGEDAFPFHSHAYSEFLYTMAGEGVLIADAARPDVVEVCGPGHLHVARAGLRHGSRWKLGPGKVWRGLIIQFDLALPPCDGRPQNDLSLAQQFAPFYDFFFLQKRDTLQLPAPVHAEVVEMAERMNDWVRRHPEAAPAAIAGGAIELIGLFSSYLCAAGLACGKGIVMPLGTIERQLARAKELLEDPLLAQLPISEIARRVGMSLYHFIRAFGKAFAVPPQKYRHSVIMERASKMLIQTDQPIYLVAEHAGFANPSAFSKSFHKHFKKSPIAFRASYNRVV